MPQLGSRVGALHRMRALEQRASHEAGCTTGRLPGRWCEYQACCAAGSVFKRLPAIQEGCAESGLLRRRLRVRLAAQTSGCTADVLRSR